MKRFLALCLSLCLALALAAPAWAAETLEDTKINGFDLIEKGEVVMNGTVTVTGNNASLIQSLSIQLNGTMNLVHDVGPGYATLGAVSYTHLPGVSILATITTIYICIISPLQLNLIHPPKRPPATLAYPQARIL